MDDGEERKMQSKDFVNTPMDDWNRLLKINEARDRIKYDVLQFASPELRSKIERDEQAFKETENLWRCQHTAAQTQHTAAQNEHIDIQWCTYDTMWAVFLLIGGLIGGCVAGYEKLDSTGLLLHKRESVITAQANWFVGESKDCTSSPDGFGVAKGNAVQSLSCDDGPEHRVRITFFGRVNQPEYVLVQWKCTRSAEGFTCSELSGIRP